MGKGMTYYVLFIVWFIAISFFTLVFWLKPKSLSSFWENSVVAPIQDIVVSLFAVIFFITCFMLGVLISVIRLKGIV